MKNLIKKLLSLIIACSCSFSLLACLDTNPQKCSHSWSEANCKFPQTCNLCQETRGTVSDHNYKNGACITCGEADPKVKQLDLGKTAYQNLNLLSSYCSIMAKSIYRAWYFAIYKADNSSYLLNPKLGIDQYAKDTMLGSDLIIQSIDKYLETLNLNSSNVNL